MFLLGAYINFDPSFATTTLTYAGYLFNDLSPILWFIGSVLVFGTIVSVIMRSLHRN